MSVRLIILLDIKIQTEQFFKHYITISAPWLFSTLSLAMDTKFRYVQDCECGLGLWPRLNASLVCNAQCRCGGICGAI